MGGTTCAKYRCATVLASGALFVANVRRGLAFAVRIAFMAGALASIRRR
jgi:hypothetical protein